MILNTSEKGTLLFNNNIIENKNQKKSLLFQLFFKNEIEIVIKHESDISKS